MSDGTPKYATQAVGEFHVIGIAIRTSNGRPDEIGALWQRFDESAMREIPSPLSLEPHGVYFDYEGDHTAPFTVLAGLPVAPQVEPPAGMMKRRIKAATYAVFPGAGPLPGSVIATWETIWNSKLKRTYLADFEVYHSPASLSVYIGVD
jgi:predicted transcriptional regulator YdeE